MSTMERFGRPCAVGTLWAGLLCWDGLAAAQPGAPASVSAVARAGWVSVTWSPVRGAEEVEGYHVYRSLAAGGPYALLATVPCAPACEYRDEGVANGTKYFYVVRAFGRGGREGSSGPEAAAVGDTVAPSAVIRAPSAGTRFSSRGPAVVVGTAIDAASGVAGVRVGIRRNDTQEWWTGTGWAAGKPVELPAAVGKGGPTVKWTFDAAGVMWSQATTYTLRVGVRDAAGYDLSPADVSTLFVDAPAILTVSLAAAPGTVTVGQVVNVTVLVANTGGSEAVGIEPAVPTAEGPTTPATGGPAAAAVPSLAPGEFATFSWAFTATAGGMVRFRAGCRGTDGPTGASATVVPGVSNDVQVALPARLEAAVAVSPANVRQGTAVSVRMRVTNVGQSDARVTSASLAPATPGLVGTLAGPDPAPPFRLRGGESRVLVWTASAAGAGTVAFTGLAGGVDETSGAAADSRPHTSAALGVASAPALLQLATTSDAAVTGSRVAVTAAVRDGAGIPVPGTRVVFGMLAGKGKLDAGWGVTDESGIATAALTLPAEAGISTVQGQVGALLASLSVEAVLPGGVAQILSRSFFDPGRGESVDVKVRIPRAGRVRVRVFNLNGELIGTLADANAAAGEVTYTWTGRNAAGDLVPNGVYFISAQAGTSLQSRRVSVLRR